MKRQKGEFPLEYHMTYSCTKWQKQNTGSKVVVKRSPVSITPREKNPSVLVYVFYLMSKELIDRSLGIGIAWWLKFSWTFERRPP